MHLLKYDEDGELTITNFNNDEPPPYAILSHTWGPDTEEVTFADLAERGGKAKPGYSKIRFCGKQAQHDGLQYFWVDTCCIDKANKAELAFAIRSMFRWYRNSTRCYVYLSDVPSPPLDGGNARNPQAYKSSFQKSKWFTRGWTLQELLAPSVVDFFSKEEMKLGDKPSLITELCEITRIPIPALQGEPLSEFSVNERISWNEPRETKIPADHAYSLMGILGVSLSPIDGESPAEAMKLIIDEVEKQNKCIQTTRSALRT
jgi:hypothetical protein